MQQTENYKLNKPETSDPFTPAPLSENADKLDAALADLDQRVIPLERGRIMMGWYKGNGDSSVGVTIDLGERPLAVLVMYCAAGHGYCGLTVGEHIAGDSYGYPALKTVENGFWVSSSLNAAYSGGYTYLAFMGDWDTEDFPNPPPKP